MKDESRRTIQELTARYELEPELNDVFVEGGFDYDLFSASISNDDEYRFYPIETVNIPSSVLEKYNLTSGNKQRVIALSKELSGYLSSDANYLCLTDRDLDHWFEIIADTKNHRWTKYTSLEMYFFDKLYLLNLICTVGKAKISSFDDFYESFVDVAKKLYAFRCAERQLKMAFDRVDFKKSMSISGSRIDFDFDGYIGKTLQKNSRHSCASDFSNSCESWLEKFDGDEKMYVRGHDFVDLAAWSIKKFKGVPGIASSEALYRIFINTVMHNGALASEISSEVQCA